MKARLIFPILILTLAGLACNRPLQTPPAAASPSLTLPVLPAATATPTLLAASHYFYEEDFNTDLVDWSTTVTSGDKGLLDVRREKGFLIFDIGDRNLSALSFFPSYNYKNVWMDFRVVNRGKTEYAINAICRYNKAEGWYQFEIFNSGLFNLYYVSWDEDLKPVPNLLASGGSDAIHPGSTPNVFSIICNDRTLSLYINGRMAGSYIDNQYALRAGQLGIGVTSFDNVPVVVAFDWVKLETP